MSTIAITGAGGFLGWHTRCAARAAGIDTAPINVGNGFSADAASAALDGSPRLVHIAGVNRGTDDEVREGNIAFARQAAQALEAAENPPPVVVFANSIHARHESPHADSAYGAAKREAADILRDAAQRCGSSFVDVHLPNLFGEHGRPHYNSVVSTFCHTLAAGGEPRVDSDSALTLLHAQDAADLLLGTEPAAVNGAQTITVTELRDTLTRMARDWSAGDIPEIRSRLDRELLRTYQSFAFAAGAARPLTVRSDERGRLFELARTLGAPGQVTFSTTIAGQSRANHFHRRKIERLFPVSGRAVVTLRRLFTDEVLTVELDSEQPHAVDIPALWVHRIHNPGPAELGLAYWADSVFNPQAPDTTADQV